MLSGCMCRVNTVIEKQMTLQLQTMSLSTTNITKTSQNPLGANSNPCRVTKVCACEGACAAPGADYHGNKVEFAVRSHWIMPLGTLDSCQTVLCAFTDYTP